MMKNMFIFIYFFFFQGLPFTTVQHKVTTMDAQPSVDGTSIIVLVTGQLIVRLQIIRK